jgi:hypothetical protein
MAYLNLLAAVDPKQVAHLRENSGFRLAPSILVGVPHLLSNRGWITHPPLTSVLAEALDGGELLTGSLWHPLRVPKYHPPGEVAVLASRLDEIWQSTLAEWPLPDDDWYRPSPARSATTDPPRSAPLRTLVRRAWLPDLPLLRLRTR